MVIPPTPTSLFFFFNDTATTEIYTLSLHDALPISPRDRAGGAAGVAGPGRPQQGLLQDRKSTRLNSSHRCISYAVFCLKKKNGRCDNQLRDLRRGSIAARRGGVSRCSAARVARHCT